MRKNDLLFVYGTLRIGGTADILSGGTADFVTFLRPDKVNGEMFSLGAYPGVVLPDGPGHFDPGKSSVTGDVLRIDDDDVVPLLDTYEGYPFLYDRCQTELAGGGHAWVYTFNGLGSDDCRVRSGDWQEFLVSARHPSTSLRQEVLS